MFGSGSLDHPTQRIHRGCSFPVTHGPPWALQIHFTPPSTMETVLIHMELIIFCLTLLIIYISYARESTRWITHFTMSFLCDLDGWQKPFLSSEAKRAGLRSLAFWKEGRKKGNIDICKFWIHCLSLTGIFYLGASERARWAPMS